MTKKSVLAVVVVVVLMFGTILTVNAGVIPKAARSASSWSVESYPGADDSDVASDIRDGGSNISIYTHSYSSISSGSQPVYATSPQSPDRLGINSTGLRSMSYSGSVGKNDRIDVYFYAYSSTDRIVANGTINAW